jgi:hypothetical protein
MNLVADFFIALGLIAVMILLQILAERSVLRERLRSGQIDHECQPAGCSRECKPGEAVSEHSSVFKQKITKRSADHAP